MNILRNSIRKMLAITGTVAMTSLVAIPVAVNPWLSQDTYAADQAHQGAGQQGGKGGGQGARGSDQGQGGSKSVFDKILSIFSSDEEADDDSDRPE